MNRIILFLLGAVLLSSACEKDLLRPDIEARPQAVFHYLWNDLHQRYAFFEEKDIDWQEVKQRYASEIKPNMSNKALFDLLSDMLFELQDGHVNLSSGFDRSRNWTWFEGYPDNFDANVVKRYYLGSDYRITGALENTIIDSVLYVRYASFASTVTLGQLNFIIDRAKNTKGIIIDVRHNGGGSIGNAYRFAGAFTEKPYVFGKQRFKTGKTSFSEWEELSVEPISENPFQGKVVVLSNRRSYSAANFFLQMMKERPNTILMGDHSGGGGGIPAFGELPNGWVYRFSASQLIDLESRQLEFGVKVHQRASTTPEDATKGIDAIIEKALKEF